MAAAAKGAPLAGVRVLDLTRLLPVPLGAMTAVAGLPDVSAKIEALGLQVAGGKPEALQKVVRAAAATPAPCP